MSQQLIIFDVGANDGKTFLRHALDGHRVYAFEPTPKLISDIKQWLHPKIFPNYKLIEKAVSIENGSAVFNIAGHYDWGCSSLLEFADNLEFSPWAGTWLGYTSNQNKVTERIEVETIRLDTFIEQNENIPYISYLHIDTQGHDLAVMKSLGKYIQIVQSGCVEVPMSKNAQLYKNHHTKEEMIAFLTENGFEIKQIQQQTNEENIYFERKESVI
jgi:FkbM family methyltransferase